MIVEQAAQVVLRASFGGDDPRDVFERVADVERFPELMPVVESVSILEEDAYGARVVDWGVRLRGSLLKWRERAVVGRDQLRIEFMQLDGDLEVFAGWWQVRQEAGVTTVEVSVEFLIGIPLLANMLQPVAGESLQNSLRAMLTGIGGAPEVGDAAVAH